MRINAMNQAYDHPPFCSIKQNHQASVTVDDRHHGPDWGGMLKDERFCVFILVSQYGHGDTPSLPISLMGIFRWQHWQTGRLFNWGGAAAPALPHYIMVEWLLKQDAHGPSPDIS
jgi:hypothetical protein